MKQKLTDMIRDLERRAALNEADAKRSALVRAMPRTQPESPVNSDA